MKKIIFFMLIVIISFTILCSCNRSMFGTYNFTHVHICDNAGHTADYAIKSWTEQSETPGVEVKIEGYGSMWLSEGTYILYTDKCPICDR